MENEKKFELYYPRAIVYPGLDLKVIGEYENYYPQGAVIHFTAGSGDLKQATTQARNDGYVYFVIDRDGNVSQNFPLSHWGHHCGTSAWADLGTQLSKKLVGIELISWGRVHPLPDGMFETWVGSKVDQANVRYATYPEYLNPGFYHKFTINQEATLIDLILWLKKNNPKTFNLNYVVGHDEVRAFAGKRGDKLDPGGSLSLPMEDYREFIKQKYNTYL